jgi:hypothetical protein
MYTLYEYQAPKPLIAIGTRMLARDSTPRMIRKKKKGVLFSKILVKRV